MKKENIDKLSKPPKWFQDIIEDEVWEYKTLPWKLEELQSKHNSLQRESKKEKEKIEKLQKTNSQLLKSLNKLVELKVLEFKEDGETFCDEYWNWGWWRQALWIYNEEVIYEDGETF